MVLNHNNSWLQDDYIESFFNNFSSEMELSRDCDLFCGPSVTNLINLGSSYEALQILTDQQLELQSYIFFSIYDSNLKYS